MTAPPTCTRPIPPEFTPNGSPTPSEETQRLFESFSKKIWPRKRWRRRGEQLNWWVRMLVQSLSACSGGVWLADMSGFIVVDMFRLFTHVGILLWGSEYRPFEYGKHPFLRLALLWRTSFWPPSMVYISVITNYNLFHTKCYVKSFIIWCLLHFDNIIATCLEFGPSTYLCDSHSKSAH